MAAVTELAQLARLQFRPERSRPVWRNRNTGRTVIVRSLGVDGRGGFQGGCTQFVVYLHEPPLPGPANPPGEEYRGRPWSLWSFLEHHEPAGEHVDVAELDLPVEETQPHYRRTMFA